MPTQSTNEIPLPVRRQVATLLYREAISMDWELRNNDEKDAQYTRWVDDPEIGGRIAQYRPLSKVRVWIKDTPMKEFDRALEGIHEIYSDCAEQGYAGPQEILEKAGLDGWTVKPGSVGEKPMHVTARSGQAERYVCWGKSEKFNDLITAALHQAFLSGGTPLIVVSSRPDALVSEALRDEHVMKGERCGFNVVHIERSLVPRSPVRTDDALF